MIYNAIIYCNFRNPEVREGILEHWKPEIPDVGVDEIIHDFVVLEKQGDKRVYHALISTSSGNDGQIARIKDYIRSINGTVAPILQGPEGSTPIAQQILSWWDKTVEGMYTKMWKDRNVHAVFETIAKGVLRYSVNTLCDGEPCIKVVSITDAENIYGETIDPTKIMIPHSFMGVG